MFRFNQNKNAAYKTLPDDIIFAILSKLPIESLQRFRCVCKHWCNLTYDPHFMETHHKLQPPRIVLLSRPELTGQVVQSIPVMTKQKLYIMDQCFEVQEIPNEHLGGKLQLCIAGSCNGLICLATNEDGLDPIIICNPITRESIVLPEVKPDHARNISDYDCLSVGFGFHPPTTEYKVVRVYRCYSEIIAEIITLGAKEWRKLDMPCHTQIEDEVRTLVMDGKMHWVIEAPDYVDKVVIMSFDIGNETFEAVSTPPQVRHMFFDMKKLTLQNIGGHLTVVEQISRNHLRMWFLMDRDKKIWSDQRVCEANEMIKYIQSYPSVVDYLYYSGKWTGASMVQSLIENGFIALYMRMEATKMVFQVIRLDDSRSDFGVRVHWIANKYMPMLTSLKDIVDQPAVSPHK